MTSFGLFAGLLGAVAAVFLTLPQWRIVRQGGALSLPLLGLPVVVLLAAAVIYPTVSTWREDPIHAGLAISASITDAAEPRPGIRVRIRLGSELDVQDFGSEAALFLFARSAAAGPPVAVLRRQVTELPGDFVLTDDNAMLPGTSLGDFAELKIVARISRAGVAEAQSGDYFGEALSRPGTKTLVSVSIDRIVK